MISLVSCKHGVNVLRYNYEAMLMACRLREDQITQERTFIHDNTKLATIQYGYFGRTSVIIFGDKRAEVRLFKSTAKDIWTKR